MKTVTVTVKPVRAGEIVSGIYQRQRKRPDGTWTVQENIVLIANDHGDTQNFTLQDDERLIVEGAANKRVVMDPNQNVATPQAIPPKMRPANTQDEDEFSPKELAADLSQRGSAFLTAIEQERKAQLITAARLKLKEPPKVASPPPLEGVPNGSDNFD